MPLSIRTKLIFSMLAVAVSAIVVISVAVFTQHRAFDRQQAIQNLNAMSKIIASNTKAAMFFNDVPSAQTTLSALVSNPDILRADLFDANGKEFANYKSDKASDLLFNPQDLVNSVLSSRHEQVVLDENGLHVLTPLLVNGELLGVLHIRDSMASELQQERQFLVFVLGASILALVASILLALWLQSLFTRPLNRFLNVIHRIRSDRDYAQRLTYDSTDEFSFLAQNFNGMIAEVEKRGQQLGKANRELEQRVQDRTEDLEKALQSATDANRAKSDFLAVMSHEIRTPLNGVIGFAELLKTYDFKGHLSDTVSMLNLSAQSLLSLLNQILDFSKLEGKNTELDLSVFDIDAFIHSVIDSHKAAAEVAGIDLKLNGGSFKHQFYQGDPLRLRQILHNLISNSIKFTREGSVTVEVSEQDRGLDSLVTFRITDTGVGIEADQLDSVFSAFTQADSTITRKYGGTGLGLSICQQLVDLMNGQIGAESQPGEGSTFWFAVPLMSSASSQIVDDEEKTTETEIPLRALHVLIAEDNSINQVVVQSLLSSLGHSCEIVSNGAEAVEAATDKKFDVILMDYHMPVMDGVCATREIRALGPESDNYSTPIIALTADIQSDVGQLFQEAGADDVLLKPFSRQALSDCLSRWASEEPPTTAAATNPPSGKVSL